MKKLLLIIVCIIVAIGAYATYLYTASCGAQTYTVHPSAFDSIEEAWDFYKELDAALCGH